MNLFAKPIPVFMYHQLSEPANSSLVVPPAAFARQVEWLVRKSFEFLSLDEVTDRGGTVRRSERVVALSFDDGFRDNYENGFGLLSRVKKTAALFVVVDWVGRNGFMGWKEIREIADLGFTIGSHSLSHRWLPDLKDEDELKREIRDSKKAIEDQIGREVKHFGYPVGGVSEKVAEEVRKAGYRAAWVAGATLTVRIKDPLFRLKRVKISPSDKNLLHFALKAYGFSQPF